MASMEEYELDTDTVREHKKRVFRNGVNIVLVVCPLMMLLVFYLAFSVARGYASRSSTTDPMTAEMWLQASPIMFVTLLIAGAINAIIIYIIKRGFRKLNQKNIETSAVKKWIFYTFTFVIAIVLAPVSLFISLYVISTLLFIVGVEPP